MNIQLFNVIKYVRAYLSPLLRGPRLLDYLESITFPIQSKRDQLTNVLYPDLERKARFNSQVMKFEKILNDIFSTGTLITIDESGVDARDYLFRRADNTPLYLTRRADGKPTFLNRRASYFPANDFTVNVPQYLYNSSLVQLKNAINKYKLVGVTYNIKPF